MPPKYKVEAAKGTRILSMDPLELEDYTVWSVTRVNNNFSWLIGKYKSAKAAHVIAAVLTALGDDVAD
jgi:hypothetical protein